MPFDPRPSVPARRSSEVTAGTALQKTASAELPDMGADVWRMAPIRWAGNTVSSLNSTLGTGTSFLNDMNTASFQASSFVVAPYVAQWTGSVNYNLGKSSYSSAAGQNVKSTSSGLGFGLGAEILPQSRYPLSVSFSQGNSETRAYDIGQQTRFSNFAVRQQYRPEEGSERYGAAFTRSSYITATGSSNSTSISGDFSTSAQYDYDHLLEGAHSLSAAVGYTASGADDIYTEKANLIFGRMSHSWRVHEDLDIRNSLQYSRNQRLAAQQASSIDNSANLLLGTTAFTWRPYEDMPLTLVGGGNLIHTQVTDAGALTSMLNLQANVMGTYRFNNNLSAAGGVSAGMTTSVGRRDLVNTQSGSVSYSGDPLQFLGFNYGWGVGAGASRNASTTGSNSVGSNLSASHNLGRIIAFGGNQTINFSASQSLSRSTSDQGASLSLSNNMGASWSSSLTAALSGNLSTTFSDSVSNGPTGTNHFQTANLTGSGAYQFSRNASATVNAGLNWSRAVASTSGFQTINGITIDNSAPTMQGNFNVGYTHRNVFAIQRLNYSANLMYVNSFSNQRLEAAVADALQSQQSISMQHLFDYRVGKLAFSLRMTAIDQAGRKSASIFGAVTRDFDGIFDSRW